MRLVKLLNMVGDLGDSSPSTDYSIHIGRRGLKGVGWRVEIPKLSQVVIVYYPGAGRSRSNWLARRLRCYRPFQLRKLEAQNDNVNRTPDSTVYGKRSVVKERVGELIRWLKGETEDSTVVCIKHKAVTHLDWLDCGLLHQLWSVC